MPPDLIPGRGHSLWIVPVRKGGLARRILVELDQKGALVQVIKGVRISSEGKVERRHRKPAPLTKPGRGPASVATSGSGRGKKHAVVPPAEAAVAVSSDPVENARRRLITKRLDRLEEIRDVWRLHDEGRSQREIATMLGTTQPRIMRILNGTTRPDVDTVEELVLGAAKDSSRSRPALIDDICRLPWRDDEWSPTGESKTIGTLTMLRSLELEGLMSREEIAAIVDKHRP